MVERTYSTAEVFTKELQYTAAVHPLTSIQWQIIQSTSFLTLSLGAAAGALLSFAVPVLGALAAKRPITETDKTNLIVSALISVLILLIGAFADRRRRKIIKFIDKSLLGDSQLGLSNDG